MCYYVTAVSQARRSLWERIFGQDILPVLSATPRLAEQRNGSRLVYDLALDDLHPMQARRLAGWMAKQQRMDYSQAQRWISTRGVFIEANEVVVVTADELLARRPFRVAKGESWQRTDSLHAANATRSLSRQRSPVGR